MNDIQIFNTPEEALCYLTECTCATVDYLELQRRPPKNELARQKLLVEIGIRNLMVYKFTAEHADEIRCGRVAKRLVQ